MTGTNWYDAVYGNDPSTDNIFGREALAQSRDPLLHAYLSRGGRLSDFARHRAQTRLAAILDRALAAPALAPPVSARLLPWQVGP